MRYICSEPGTMWMRGSARRQSGRALAELAERVRRVVRACVVQTANMGRNLAGDDSSWRPKLEVWTAYAPAWKEMREM